MAGTNAALMTTGTIRMDEDAQIDVSVNRRLLQEGVDGGPGLWQVTVKAEVTAVNS